MLLEILDELGDDDVADVRQSADLDRKVAADDGRGQAVKKEERPSDG